MIAPPNNRCRIRTLILFAAVLATAPFASAAVIRRMAEDPAKERPAIELPEVFQRLPIHTRGVVYVRDYKAAPWVETIFAAAGLAQPALLGLKPLLPDEALVALLDVGKGDHVVVLAGIKVGDVPAFWKAFPPLAKAAAQPDNPLALPAAEPRGEVALCVARVGFLAHGQGWIWFSNSEPVAQAAAAGTLAGDTPLPKSALFQRAMQDCDGAAPLLAWLDVETAVLPLLAQKIRNLPMLRSLSGLNLEGTHSLGLSAKGGQVSGRIVLDSPGYGLPRLLLAHNRPSRLLALASPDADFVRLPLDTGRDVLQVWRAMMGALDPDAVSEMDAEFVEFRAQNGVDFQAEVLDRLVDEAIVLTPSLTGGGKAVLFGLKEPKPFEEVLRKLFGMWQKPPAREAVGAGALYTKPPLALGIAEDWFAIGNEALVRQLLLADPKAYKAPDRQTGDRLRQPCATFARVDIGRLAAGSLKVTKTDAFWLEPLVRSLLSGRLHAMLQKSGGDGRFTFDWVSMPRRVPVQGQQPAGGLPPAGEEF